jgi:NAD(P)H-hydrate epimerase
MPKDNRRQRALSASQAKSLDDKAVRKFGIPVLLLMENAGGAVSAEALHALRRRKGRVAVFCGTGNNGGDGFCAARHLLANGVKLDVYLAGKTGDVKNEAKVNLDILLRLKQKITPVTPGRLVSLKKKPRAYCLIIDALLGVGIKGAPRYIYEQLIGIINSSGACVISVDIPSGMDADSGDTPGACVKADRTVTFVAMKRGMFSGAAGKYCGKIITRSIGVAL